MKQKPVSDASKKSTKGNKKSGATRSAVADDRTPQQRLGDAIRTSAGRETVEAFVVAFILALLFRAFIAEAFVIPTGSMAPTLMGAHKDVICDQCQQRFQVGASKEREGPVQDLTVVAGICPNCRYLNNLDLANTSDDGTFNGDRILVSKYAYAINEPERWDVIVFKFPGNPKQNYIKRLVGLPDETLTIRHGDIYVSPGDAPEGKQILRKPADKLMAMAHHVYDTDKQSEYLIKSNFPSRIQPWRPGASSPPDDSWTVKRSKEGLVATVDADQQPEWVRYFHHWPDDRQWEQAGAEAALDPVDPYSSRLITDFYAYDCYILVPSRAIYTTSPSNARLSRGVPFDPDYQSGGAITQFGGLPRCGTSGYANEGMHWVGDLIAETAITTDADCEQMIVELVESGIRYQCRIDLESGQAKLVILDGEKQLPFTTAGGESVLSPTASTGVIAGTDCSVQMSNCDDQILLWVNDELVSFDGPTTFDAGQFRSDQDSGPRYQPGVHPLDASPVGVAVSGGKATISRVKILRDKYYIADDNSDFGIRDYDSSKLFSLRDENISQRDIQTIMARPELWSEYPIWSTRRKVTFRLEEDQFFPMGDNSPESLDARCWAGAKAFGGLPKRFEEQAYRFAEASYVPRDLLVGKALVVFWPHPWNTPVPFTPNFDRFRLIR